MKKALVVLALLAAGAILWANYGGVAKDTAAGALRDTANKIGVMEGRK